MSFSGVDDALLKDIPDLTRLFDLAFAGWFAVTISVRAASAAWASPSSRMRAMF
jgi:hypothetical protein